MRIVNGYFADGVPEKSGEGYASIWHRSRGEMEERNNACRRGRVDRCVSPESASKDIVDLLPSDPFGMEIKTTFTAITGWLEDLEVDYGGYITSCNVGWLEDLEVDNGGYVTSSNDLEVDYGGYITSSNVGVSQKDCSLFAGWHLIWNNALKFQSLAKNVQFNEKMNARNRSTPSNFQVDEELHLGISTFPSSVQSDEILNVASEMNQYGEEDRGVALASCEFGYQSACNMRDIVAFEYGSSSSGCELQFAEKVEGDFNFEGTPNEALTFALSYLGVKDLLSVERVCRSLCSTVRGDPLLWMSIHIDQPLNERITDDILVQLADRALGNLQCLSLVDCPRVTDDGLSRILETNLRLTKLSVPGCTRLSIDGIMNNIKMYNSNKEDRGIKHLRIGALYGVTPEHFAELKLLLGVNAHELESHQKPRFYHRGNFYLPFDDDRAIDIEKCPKCEKFRLVYDCPNVGCQVKDETAQVCRACTLCIARCAQCGRCVNDTEYEETFSLELVCSYCFKQLLKYQDSLDKKVEPSRDLLEPYYNFSLHG